MVSALDFQSGGRWFMPVSAVVLCPQTRNFIPHCLSLPTCIFKWLPAIIILKGGGGG